MSDDDRAARHRVAVDPDDDRDENTYSADKTKNPKKLRKQKAMGEAYIDEKTLTPGETKKKEEIVKSMKKSAGDFEKRYPGRGKEVMYATATKQAKKVAEAVADQAALSPQELQKQKQKATLDTQIAMLRKQSLSKAEKPGITKEEYLDEKQSALDIVKAKMGSALMTGPTKKPELTAAQKAARKKASDAYLKKTSDYLHSSPRD